MGLMNKSIFENLIKAGAFDEILKNRARLMNVMPIYLKAIQGITKKKDDRQLDLFSLLEEGENDEEAMTSNEPEMPEVNEYDEHEKLNFEKEVTGLYISGHPYDSYEKKLKKFTNCKISDIYNWRSEKIKIRAGGIITSLTERTTKKNQTMCNLQFEDNEDNIEVVIFPNVWEEVKGTISKGMACVIEGQKSKNGNGNFVFEKLIDTENPEIIPDEYVIVPVEVDNIEKFDFHEFVNSVKDCGGNSKLILELKNDDETEQLCVNSCFVDPVKIFEKLNL